MLSINDLVSKFSEGAIGVIPTDTVYGIVCFAGSLEAVARLYELKKREHKPGTLIAASIDQFVELGIPKRYMRAVEQYWPNPISIIIPIGPSLEYLHQGVGSLALRIPKDAQLRALLEQTGPLLTSSANHPGEPPATTIAMAKGFFDDQIDFYFDGGDLSDRKPSTIIRIVDDAVEVIREGAVQLNEAGEIINEF